MFYLYTPTGMLAFPNRNCILGQIVLNDEIISHISKDKPATKPMVLAVTFILNQEEV